MSFVFFYLSHPRHQQEPRTRSYSANLCGMGKYCTLAYLWIYLWKQRVTSKHVRWKIEILFKYQQREHGINNYQKRKYNTSSYGVISASIKFAYKLSSIAYYLLQHHPGVRPAVKSPILYTCVVISRERASVLRYVFIYGEIFTGCYSTHKT